MLQLIVKTLRRILPFRIFQILRVLNFLSRRSNEELESFLILDKYSNQLERLKSRQTIADGKLNLVLYGRASRINSESVFLGNPIHDHDEVQEQMTSFVVSNRGKPKALSQRYRKRIDNLRNAKLFNPQGTFVNMLDIGCGNGVVTNFFLEKFEKIKYVIGLDIEQTPFTENVSCESLRFIQTNAIDFANTYNGKFDLITLVHSMEYLSPYDQYFIFPLLKRLVEKSGYIYIELPNLYDSTVMNDTFWTDPAHHRPYSATGFLAFLAANGFHFKAGVYDQNDNIYLLSDYLNNKTQQNQHCPDLFILIHNA
ncbi:MAG: class I SAM-dependent methyltransferase [Bdellovibrionaceae bacterium]|nr:class I SAM-dependent methyltransferase [Pseudobdellovibrionaceae bacterium]